jgi:V/A-type H+-transporting ATPase subunit D
MQQFISYTKANLIATKNSLVLAQKGYELLDKKRNVLIITMMGFIDRAKEVQQKVKTVFAEAYAALQTANITLGINTVQEIAFCIPEAESFEITDTSVMGVPIPNLSYKILPNEGSYSLFSTNTSLDIATQKFFEVKVLLYELSEIEDSVYKLAMEIKRTQKRANALSNIQIPKYEALVKKISETLEEKEREEFFRLKKIKSRNASADEAKTHETRVQP